jgi:hypothetical protein
MKDIRNTTHKPLRVPLPKGKTLHLGPQLTGQVAANALEHPPFKKLVESGDIEIVGEGKAESRHPVKEHGDHADTQGMGSSKAFHPSGDR